MNAPLSPLNHELPNHADSQAICITDKANYRIRAEIPIYCTPERLYAVWRDVKHWSLWDPATASATLDGPFVAGVKGELSPAKGRTVAMVLESADPQRGFTVFCPVLGSKMHFIHSFKEVATDQSHSAGGVPKLMVSHEIVFRGWLRKPLMALVGMDAAIGLPLTMTRLKAYCEQKCFS